MVLPQICFWEIVIFHIQMEEFHKSFKRWPTRAYFRRDLHQRNAFSRQKVPGYFFRNWLKLQKLSGKRYQKVLHACTHSCMHGVQRRALVKNHHFACISTFSCSISYTHKDYGDFGSTCRMHAACTHARRHTRRNMLSIENQQGMMLGAPGKSHKSFVRNAILCVDSSHKHYDRDLMTSHHVALLGAVDISSKTHSTDIKVTLSPRSERPGRHGRCDRFS